MRLSPEDAFDIYADRVFRAAYSVCRNREDADDVVQDTFIKYCSREWDFSTPEHLKAWLLRVAINRAKDLQRQFLRKNAVSYEDYEMTLEFPEPQDREVFEAVMNLPPKYRIAIHLYYYEDYSISDIAAMLRYSQSAVKSQLSRGRSLLKSQLLEVWNDEQ